MDISLGLPPLLPKENEDFAVKVCQDTNIIHRADQGDNQVVPGDYISSFYLANCNGNLIGNHTFSFRKPVLVSGEPIILENGKILGFSSGEEYGIFNSSENQKMSNKIEGQNIDSNPQEVYEKISEHFPGVQEIPNIHPIATSVLATRLLAGVYQENLDEFELFYDEESSLANYTKFNFSIFPNILDVNGSGLEFLLSHSCRYLPRLGVVKQKVSGFAMDSNGKPVLSLEKEVAFMNLVPISRKSQQHPSAQPYGQGQLFASQT